MINFLFTKWFGNISIAGKLYLAVGIMASLIAFELITLMFAINTLSSVRAAVGAEGLWSKAQKDALYELRKYSRSANEDDYKQYLEFLKIPLSYRKALGEIKSGKYDFGIMRQSFLEGQMDSDDIDGVNKLFKRFHSILFIHQATNSWSKGDSLITELQKSAKKFHAVILASDVSKNEKIEQSLNKINALNVELTSAANQFSEKLGEGSRWLESLVLKLLLVVALSVGLSGLLLTIYVSRGIQKGLGEILRASKLIAKGDFTAKAKAYSKDEIGVLANSFNMMAEELNQTTLDNKEAHAILKNYTRRLEQSNNNLEQFAYVASHDLQEPLRTITNFTKLLEEKQKGNLDAASLKYMNYVVSAAERMKHLISDMLSFSRIGKLRIVEPVNFKELLDDVLIDMSFLISENKATVTIGHLPILHTSKTEAKLLFQNLITNAIKYAKADVPSQIEIQARQQANGDWLLSVKDNGIGIDPLFKDKIFVIFQRLHNQDQYSGTGIGLATCKKIVELNGGVIWVDSKPNEGSTFYFTYPKV